MYTLLFLLIPSFTPSYEPISMPSDSIILIHQEAEKKVQVKINDQVVTAYFFPDEMEKPVLYPVNTVEGIPVTRGFPFEQREGERVDHPHHAGCWLNYGDVNGLDFWNNSDAIPDEKKSEYGVIRHNNIEQLTSGEGEAILSVSASWLTYEGEVLLKEATTFNFSIEDHGYSILRTTTLTATEKEVLFEDNKEGMVAIRVRRELEHPTDKPIVLTDAKGNPTEVPIMDNEKVSGSYLSSEGITGVDVWGKRAKWMKLGGKVEGTPISLILMDHPKNTGYPTYWHARGYGLFAANPLGQEIFSEGEEALHFSLQPGERTTFTYKLMIISEVEIEAEEINQMFDSFVQ